MNHFMKKIFFAFALFAAFCANGQSYRDSILLWQRHYKEEFLTDARSPLKASDTGFLRFAPINKKWRVIATVKQTPEALPFDMATHSGKTKRFRQWAVLEFVHPLSRGLQYLRLPAYERVDPPAGDTLSRTLLFIPFNDETNGIITYGGGRYMDIPKSAVADGKLELDFNKAYNPWCAFADGYSCPIPPAENALHCAVKAGELMPESHK